MGRNTYDVRELSDIRKAIRDGLMVCVQLNDGTWQLVNGVRKIAGSYHLETLAGGVDTFKDVAFLSDVHEVQDLLAARSTAIAA